MLSTGPWFLTPNPWDFVRLFGFKKNSNIYRLYISNFWARCKSAPQSQTHYFYMETYAYHTNGVNKDFKWLYILTCEIVRVSINILTWQITKDQDSGLFKSKWSIIGSTRIPGSSAHLAQGLFPSYHTVWWTWPCYTTIPFASWI